MIQCFPHAGSVAYEKFGPKRRFFIQMGSIPWVGLRVVREASGSSSTRWPRRPAARIRQIHRELIRFINSSSSHRLPCWDKKRVKLWVRLVKTLQDRA